MSSNNRKTAFARVPRGAQSGPRNSSGPSLRIDKRFLDSLTSARMAPDMSTVLTKTSSELTVNIAANGKGNFTISQQGNVLGDAQDVQKVQTLGTFINDERKSVLKSSVSKNTTKTLAAIVQASREGQYQELVPRPITKINKSFVDIFRSVENAAGIIAANLEAIASAHCEGEANTSVRNHLIESANRSKEAIGKFLFYRAGISGEEANPRKLNDFLIEGNVINWVYTRLSTQKLLLGGKDFEFRRVYFPKDITKGLILSYEEFKKHDLVDNQGVILTGLRNLASIWSDPVVRAVCGIPDWDLENFGADSPARVLKNVPLMVVPFPGATSVEENISVLARSGDRGLPFSVGNTLTPQDFLKFLGTVPKRTFHALVPHPAMRSNVLETIFDGFTYDRTNQERRGLYAQLHAWSKEPGANLTWFDAIVHQDGSRDTEPLVQVIRRIWESLLDCGGNRAITDPLRAAAREFVPISRGETAANVDLWSVFLTLKGNMPEGRASEILAGIVDVDLNPRRKDAKDDGVRTARSPLSPAGTSLVEDLRRKGYAELSRRVGAWLRSFLTATVQSAVADVMHARLEASLANPVAYDSRDRVAYFEATDWAEDTESTAEAPEDEPEEEMNPDEE